LRIVNVPGEFVEFTDGIEVTIATSRAWMKRRGKHCQGIAGIIEEGKAIMEEDFDDSTMDACLIAVGSASRAL
jgi:ferritin-like metal-binding protein YciE